MKSEVYKNKENFLFDVTNIFLVSLNLFQNDILGELLRLRLLELQEYYQASKNQDFLNLATLISLKIDFKSNPSYRQIYNQIKS